MTRVWGVVFLLIVLLLQAAAPTSVWALQRPPGIQQYKLTAWRAEQGAPHDIYKIAQAPDGFLWLATSTGLYRFDGFTFDKIPPIAGDRTRSPQLTTVLAARDGSIWVGYYWGGLSVYRHGALENANHGPPTGAVWKIVQAPDGAIWVATGGMKGVQLSRFKAGRWTDAGVSLGLHAIIFDDMAFTNDGTLYVAADKFLAVLRPGSRQYTITSLSREGHAFLKNAGKDLWLLDSKSAFKITHSNSERILLPSDVNLDSISGPCELFSRSGDLFVCRPDHAIDVDRPVSVNQNKGGPKTKISIVKTFMLSPDEPHSTLEDMEGNIWVGSSGGLYQIRAAPITTYPLHATPPEHDPWLTASSDGKVYFADQNRLIQIDKLGKFTTVFENSQRAGNITTLCADKGGGIWILSKSILHWFNGRTVSIARDSGWSVLPQFNDCAVDDRGDLWLSLAFNGLFRLHEGAWRQVVLDSAHPRLGVDYIASDRNGGVLAYTARGKLYRIRETSVEPLASTDQLGIGVIRTIYNRGDEILMGGDNGLARLNGHRLQVISSDRFPWLGALSGIVQSETGDTWLNAAEGVARVRTNDIAHAFSDSNFAIPYELFDYNDGLQGSVSMLGAYEGGVTQDGRVWFESTAGVISIDPKHLYRNSSPPNVVITSVTANNHAYAANNSLALPSGTSNTQIDYTALSLTVPQRDRFRYRLQGVDKDWVDAGSRRQAFYTNLNPGRYRFDVIATNNDGVWNKTGAEFDFRIRPAFWQTPVFILMGGFAIIAFLVDSTA